jgi:ubiquinone/menaquinone biosynthesis C-methylase UbiE
MLSKRIKTEILRTTYLLSIFLPINRIWNNIHKNNYHPDVEGIKARISDSKMNPENSIFEWWKQHLGYSVKVEGLSVLEIGHGGGWFLADALDRGAKRVVGLEISDEINSRSNQALNEMGYQNFQFVKGNGKNLAIINGCTFDLIFSNTVFQHMPTRHTKKYLRSLTQLTNSEGVILIQILHSKSKSLKVLSPSDLFSISYSKKEFFSILNNCSLSVSKYVEIDYGSDINYWGLYVLTSCK